MIYSDQISWIGGIETNGSYANRAKADFYSSLDFSEGMRAAKLHCRLPVHIGIICSVSKNLSNLNLTGLIHVSCTTEDLSKIHTHLPLFGRLSYVKNVIAVTKL